MGARKNETFSKMIKLCPLFMMIFPHVRTRNVMFFKLHMQVHGRTLKRKGKKAWLL